MRMWVLRRSFVERQLEKSPLVQFLVLELAVPAALPSIGELRPCSIDYQSFYFEALYRDIHTHP